MTGQPVSFRDAGLKAAVEAQLHVTNPTPADMLKLAYLVANARAITDVTGLEYATNLATLNLSTNSISDLSVLKGLVNLTRVYLSENVIADLSPLSGCKRLQHLDLSFNQIADVSPLSKVQTLTELYLGGNEILDLTPLSGLVKLTTLDLSDNKIRNLQPLAGLTALIELSLGYNEIADISALAELAKLTDLDLGLNQVTDISPLAGLTRLKALHLSNNRIRDIAPLLPLTGLTLLSIEYDNPLNPAAYCVYIPCILQANPGMTLFHDPTPPLAPGDCTGDCRTDFRDFAGLARSWRVLLQDTAAMDFDRNWVVDAADVAILADNWLGPIQIREFPLDASPGWKTEGQWQFGPPQGPGGTVSARPDPNAACTGANVYGVNLAGDYGIAKGGPWYLTTGPIDCSAFHNVTLTFARRLRTDDPSRVTSTIQVSTDGVAWQRLWHHTGTAPLTDETWTTVSYDLSAVADGRPEVRLRWGYQILDGARPYSGWNLDDITLWARP